MKKLTTMASVLVLSGFGFAANADNLGNDVGAHTETTPSMSQDLSAFNSSGNGSHYNQKVTPAQSEKSVAEFNEGIDQS